MTSPSSRAVTLTGCMDFSFALIANCVDLCEGSWESGVEGDRMDSSDFETWLSAVRSLTAAQRGRAFRELTLAEAADFSDDEDSDLACAPATIAETESRKEPT